MYYDIEHSDINIEELVSEKMKITFLILTTALLVTLGTVFMVFNSYTLVNLVYDGFMPIMILQFILAMALSSLVYKANKIILLVMLYAYSVLTGATLSFVGLVYTPLSVISILGATVVLFTVLSIYGYITKQDLTNLSSLLFGGLIALVIVGVINIFLKNSMLDLMLSFAGVAIFIVYTAYDTNKIKNNIKALAYSGDTEILDKVAIIGAFSLYLDFINLFIYLLRLFGKKK